jgi:transcriptional regulator with XRE-family HTH domain
MGALEEWLLEQIEERGWTQAELARRAGLAQSTLNRIINETRQLGPDAALAIARALGERPETVYRLAGLLPPTPAADDELKLMVQEIAEILAGLPDGPIRNEAMAGLLAIARDARERAKERERVEAESQEA